jgi:hypothetical protein
VRLEHADVLRRHALRDRDGPAVYRGLAVPLIEAQFHDTLLIIRHEPPRALVVAEGDHWVLPVVQTRNHHPADVRPTRRAIREQLGMDACVLECHEVHVGDGVAHRLLEVEPLDQCGDVAGQNGRWITAPDIADLLRTPAPIRTRLERRLDPRARQPAVVDGRAWTRAGWWTQATTWLDRRARVGGWRVCTAEQIRNWEFSCVLRVTTDGDDLYLKALPRTYAAEVALSQQLATWHRTALPTVVAADARRRWLLMRACDGHSLEEGAPLATWRRVARAYGELQVASAARVDQLRALGCRDRAPALLRALLGPLLADEAALMVGEADGLTAAEFDRLRALQPWFEAACETLAASDLPLALEHGDLWASNIYIGAGEPAFIDWTDACLSHPFFSLAPFLRSASWDPRLAGRGEARGRIVDAYLEAWYAFGGPAQLRKMLALAEPLSALHIAASYWCLTPKSHRQWWMARAVPFFTRMALDALPPGVEKTARNSSARRPLPARGPELAWGG